MPRRSNFHRLIEKENIDYEQTYTPTKKDVRKWFSTINAHVFRGRLYATFGRIEIRRRHGVWAEYSGWIDSRRNASARCQVLEERPAFRCRPSILGKKVTICGMLSMTNRFPNKQVFIEVLAHEMVHLHQFLYATPPFSYRSVSHGQSFHAWKSTFEKHGLRLRVTLKHKPIVTAKRKAKTK